MAEPHNESRKRGLVLEGGGAKGAYQFGCLLAFRNRGITFDAVAGTSVGALNALLWASDSLPEGESLYQTLSQKNLYPFRLPLPVALLHGLLAGLLSAASYVFSGARGSYLPAWLSFGVSAAYGLPPVVLLYWLVSIEGGFATSWPMIIATVYVHVMMLVAVLAMLYWAMTRRAIETLLLVAPMYVIGFVAAMASLVTSDDLGDSQTIAVTAAWVLGIGNLLVVLALIGRSVSRATLLASEPLRRTVTEFAAGTLYMPTYVTIAAEVPIFDPDEPTYFLPTEDSPAREEMPLLEWIPKYVELSKEDHRDRADVLVASAALPFGIVPPVKIGKYQFVDGGIVDNSPVYPLAVTEQCTEIVLIKCAPDDQRPIAEQLARVGRMLQLVERASPRETTLHRPLPPASRKALPSLELRVLAPSSNLGGMVQGTLNFSTRQSLRNLQRGYNDAERFCDEWGAG